MIYVALAAGLPAAAQVQQGDAAPAERWAEVTDLALEKFDRHCRTAMTDPNAFIAQAQASYETGNRGALARTDDDSIVEASFEEDGRGIVGRFHTTDRRSIWECHVFGFWLPKVDMTTGAFSFVVDTDTVVARVREHLDRRTDVQVLGGRMTAMFGDAHSLRKWETPMAGYGATALFDNSMMQVEAYWPNLDAVVHMTVNGGSVFPSAARVIDR